MFYFSGQFEDFVPQYPRVLFTFFTDQVAFESSLFQVHAQVRDQKFQGSQICTCFRIRPLSFGLCIGRWLLQRFRLRTARLGHGHEGLAKQFISERFVANFSYFRLHLKKRNKVPAARYRKSDRGTRNKKQERPEKNNCNVSKERNIHNRDCWDKKSGMEKGRRGNFAN